ncbi:ATP-dependent zinc metalloprotease FtsH 4 [Polystyrenella longa]|uniref:ATP-dependent zinc metalloprotease FtsH n=1 Tax=Polystyrenella longa TaxID=2528007 RepID=A0A518CT40_9PLAN|nr:ATP-dependent zinc metalloprotease FtsH [Polystyrenella longa]QDU82401.1 ATP-dependent zinc metalloprotease FtsH 4 [Polystyrenella longa]
MSDAPSPTPEEPESPKSNKSPKKPRKTESGGNSIWLLFIAIVLFVVATQYSGMSDNGEMMPYSNFVRGLEITLAGADLTELPADVSIRNKRNTFNVQIGSSYLYFQDQKQDSSGRSPEGTKSYRVSIDTLSEPGREDLEKKMRQAEIEYGFSPPPSPWREPFILFLMLLVFLGIFFFMLRRMGGAGSAMSFGRSRGKLYAQDDIGITFKDVAGNDEAVEEICEFVDFLKSPGKYQALGGRIPHGVLLVGPPGTGKTLLAKAVAGEAGVPFFGLSGSDFVEMFVGVGAARVRDMFAQARQRSPSIIFIDELDALGKVRGNSPGGHDEREQTLNALLVEMDGFSSDENVIVMAATNRPETLDPALMRPGRFDRQVLVDRPDVKGREAILKVHAGKVKLADDVNLTTIAKHCPGFVGADLANLVNEAALLAVRNNKTRVTMAEFDEGIERVVAGLEKQTRIIQEDEKLRVAYHECGHALVASSLPNTDPVHKISIIPRGLGALGYMLQHSEVERYLNTESELKHRICVLLGGTISEEIVFSEFSTGASNDLQRATDIARRMVTDYGMSPKLGRVHYSETQRSPFLNNSATASDTAHSEDTIREIDLEVRRIIDECLVMVRDIVNDRREVLEHLTKDLMESEVMNSEQLQAILVQYKTSPKISPGTHANPASGATPPAKDAESEEEDGGEEDQAAEG